MRVTITVNGERRQADDVWEGESLLYVLRERMGLPGSKNACEQGECGSCTVYLDGVTCCACLVAAGQADGREVATVEGLASGDALHPVQQAYLDAGAVQCGFCTPGLLVATHDLLARDPDPDDSEIREALAGNLCRCTGYEKIIEAVQLAQRSGCDERPRHRRLRGRHDGRRPVGARRGARRRRRRRIASVGGARRRATSRDATYVDGRGCLATPGLVNTHHHLYQWLTRGIARRPHAVRVADDALPGVGVPRRGHVRTGATGALVPARADRVHHDDGPPLRLPDRRRRPAGAEIEAARPSGCGSCRRAARWTSVRARAACRPTTGRGDRRDPRGDRRGDRPPPRPVPRLDAAHRRRAVLAVLGHRRPAEAAARPRPDKGVRLHTHLAETTDEDESAGREFGCSPVEYVESLGWLGHGRVAGARRALRRRRASTRWRDRAPASRTARRPTPGSARASAATRDLRAPACPSASASTGPRPTRRRRSVEECATRTVRPRRRRPDGDDGARRRSSWPRSGGAAVLGWDDQIGSLEAGKLADIALWRLDTARRTPTSRTRSPRSCSGSPPPLELLLVRGRPVVRRDAMVDVDEERLAHDVRCGRSTAAEGGRTMTTSRRADPRSPAPRAAASARAPLRPDGDLKVTGDFAYASDLWMDDMLWGVTLRSPHPYARIRSVDIGEALAVPGVFAVLTHDDVPGEKHYGLEHQDQPVLAIDVVRYQGEPVALVAADHPETARQAIEEDRRRLRRARAGHRRRGGAAAPASPQLHPHGNLVRHVKVRTRRPGPAADVVVPATTRSACRTRPSSARSPGSPCPTRSAASTSTSRPSGCMSTATRSARRWGAARTTYGCSCPASVARSAVARTCRCTCTAACSRCTPASR